MQPTNNPAEDLLNELLKHNDSSLVQLLFLYLISSHLRRVWPEFGLTHLQSIADDLNIDAGSIAIRPRDLYISSGELGAVAAAVWLEPQRAWPIWKQRLIAAGEVPPERDLNFILEQVLQLPFIERAWWAEDPGRGAS